MSDKYLYKTSPSEESCIILVNRLISQLSVPVSHVSHISEIDSNLIVLLCEIITGLSVPDLLSCENEISAAHNVQAVIDTLSLDFLGISLCHITGDAVLAGDVVAIFNLLEVLEGVMVHLSVKNHGQKILKRKIKRIKRSSSRSIDQNSIPKENNVYSSGSVRSKSETSIPSPFSECKRMKPAFSNTRLNVKEGLKNGFKENYLHKETSTKESSDSMLTAFSQTPVLSLSSVNNTLIKNSIFQKDFSSINAEQSYSREMPIFSSDCEHFGTLMPSVKDFSSINQHEVLKNMQSKPFVMKRKISKRSNSKNPGQDVEKLYEQNLEVKVKGILEKNTCLRRRSSQMRKSYLQLMKKPMKKSPLPTCNKSFLLPYSLRRRSTATVHKKHSVSQKSNSSPKLATSKEVLLQKTDNDNDPKQHISFMKELLDEFPGIELSPTIMNHVRTKYGQHLLKMHKKVKACLLKKPKAEIEAEKAAEKQRTISKILEKDLHQQQYLNELKEQKSHQNKIKYRLRDARLKSVKMKQYCDEFHQEMQKKMQKRNYSEEIIFEKAFKEAVNIQKDHVDRLCQEVIDAAESDSKQYMTYLLSLENLYQTQFSLLSETLAEEKRDVQTRMKAEKQEMDKMQRDFQQALKSEIRFMQKTIVELTEDCHFRELDAEHYIERIRKM